MCKRKVKVYCGLSNSESDADFREKALQIPGVEAGKGKKLNFVKNGKTYALEHNSHDGRVTCKPGSGK